MSPETTVNPPSSQKRIEANRRNAQKSTGPRTPEGKNRSRFNGVKHGLRATVAVLPGEDPAAFQERVDALMERFAPQNPVEADLLERVAATTWSLERANRAEAARLSQLIRNDSREREEREQEEAILLGRRLFWDARGPCQLYPHTPYSGSSEPRISWSPDPNDPNQPAILVLRLERTVAGCRWLLDRWGELWRGWSRATCGWRPISSRRSGSWANSRLMRWMIRTSSRFSSPARGFSTAIPRARPSPPSPAS